MTTPLDQTKALETFAAALDAYASATWDYAEMYPRSDENDALFADCMRTKDEVLTLYRQALSLTPTERLNLPLVADSPPQRPKIPKTR